MKDISVILVTYNSSWEKTRKTIESILRQKQVDFEIVISDDGSDITNYDKIEEFFREKKFEDYVLVHNKENVGTIKNCIRALNYSQGIYIKAMSPGDLLLENSLKTLYEAILFTQKKWVFGRMMCVADSSKQEMECVAFHLGPQDIKPYEDNNVDLIKYNYICGGDKIAVTTILIEKETWLFYLKQISKYLKYVEDYSYELMINDGIIPAYVPTNVEIYEIGHGISTSNDEKWNRILSDERNIFYETIFRFKRKKEDVEKIYLPEYKEKWTGINVNKLYLTKSDYEKCCLDALDHIKNKSQNNDVWIYGAGIAGRIMLECLMENGVRPKGFIDINYQKIEDINGYKVVGISDIENNNVFLVVSLMIYRDIVVDYLRENHIDEEQYLYVYAKNTINMEW